MILSIIFILCLSVALRCIMFLVNALLDAQKELLLKEAQIKLLESKPKSKVSYFKYTFSEN